MKWKDIGREKPPYSKSVVFRTERSKNLWIGRRVCCASGTRYVSSMSFNYIPKSLWPDKWIEIPEEWLNGD